MLSQDFFGGQFPIFGCPFRAAKGVLTVQVARSGGNLVSGLGRPGQIQRVWWCGIQFLSDLISFWNFGNLGQNLVWFVVWFGGVVWWCGHDFFSCKNLSQNLVWLVVWLVVWFGATIHFRYRRHSW